MGTYHRLRPGAATVATDGAVRRDMLAAAWLDDAGGWAAARTEHRRQGTGNHGALVLVAELLAIRLAHVHHLDSPVRVLADSRDALRWVQRWLDGKALALPDEWGHHRTALAAFARNVRHRDHPLTVEWARGHAGHPLNEGADALASQAVRMSHDGISTAGLRERADGIADQFSRAYRAEEEQLQP